MTGATRFPAGFVWGAATSAYQIEGAAGQGGRGPSIWDTFARVPGRVAGGHTGEVAADHYHRYRQDTAIMADLGLGAYRFSVAWPRVQPEGRGRSTPRASTSTGGWPTASWSGIEPWITLYHWDLPQALQDRGGWASRETAGRFADYAAAVYGALRDRVANWTTLNEPWCAAFLGHAAGIHAPGVQDPATAVRAAHHLLVAHGQATRAMRALDARPRLGINLNLDPVTPASDGPADADAARRIDGIYNRLFLDPLFRGSYPADVLEDLGGLGGLEEAGEDDLAAIAAPLDLLGVNYYRRWVVAARPERPRLGGPPTPWVAAGDVEFVASDRPRTDLGWEIDPSGLDELLRRLHTDYPSLPLYVTENGAAFDDVPDAHGRVQDQATDPVPGRAPAGRPPGHPGRGRPARLLRLVAAGQLRVGRGLRQAVRHRLRGLPDPAPDCPRTAPSGTGRRSPAAAWTDRRDRGVRPADPGAGGGAGRGLPGDRLAGGQRLAQGQPGRAAQVERAVAKLGYVPNRAARSLVTRRANSVALVVSEPHARFFSEPFFAGMVRGVSATLAGTGVQLVLLIAQDLPDRGRLERYVVGGHVDGVLLASLHGDDPLPGTLERAGVPAVLVGRPVAGGSGESRWEGAGELRRRRQPRRGQQGRRPPGPAGPPADRHHHRLPGHGRRPGPPGGLPGRAGRGRAGRSRRPGRDRRLHRGGRGRGHGPAAGAAGDPVDAVFAASDLMAAGALRALRAAGRRVPEDVAVVGFEDSAVARYAQPPLTTVRQPIEEMGRQATRLLLARVAGEASGMHLILDTELVVRASA